MKHERGQVSPGIMLAAGAFVLVVYGVAAVGHVAKVGWKQTVCLVRTGHHCPKPKPLTTNATFPCVSGADGSYVCESPAQETK